MGQLKSACLALVFYFAMFISSSSAGVFNVAMTIGGVTQNFSYSNVQGVIDAVKLSNIVSRFPSYAGTEQINIAIDFRGLPLTLSSSTSSSGFSGLVMRVINASCDRW